MPSSHPSAIEAARRGGQRGPARARPRLGGRGAARGDPDRSRGSAAIENQLKIHESAEDLAAYRNGARRWVGPATRVLTGGTGSALAYAGLKRKDPLGAALGAVGLGLLAHGLTNFDPKRLASRLSRSKNGRAYEAETLAELGQPEASQAEPRLSLMKGRARGPRHFILPSARARLLSGPLEHPEQCRGLISPLREEDRAGAVSRVFARMALRNSKRFASFEGRYRARQVRIHLRMPG